jgi:hypothetical protein
VPFYVLRGILKTFVDDTVHTELIGSYIDNKEHAMNVSDNPVMPFHAFRGDYSAITNTIPTGDTRPDPENFSSSIETRIEPYIQVPVVSAVLRLLEITFSKSAGTSPPLHAEVSIVASLSPLPTVSSMNLYFLIRTVLNVFCYQSYFGTSVLQEFTQVIPYTDWYWSVTRKPLTDAPAVRQSKGSGEFCLPALTKQQLTCTDEQSASVVVLTG